MIDGAAPSCGRASDLTVNVQMESGGGIKAGFIEKLSSLSAVIFLSGSSGYFDPSIEKRIGSKAVA
jgi:hypothetical protein